MKDLTGIRITVISACRNESKHMAEFLGSILAQDFGGMLWEVIIADGMSTDGTRAMLDTYCQENPNVKVISNQGKIVSTGLNAAIRAARGEVILRMDAHTYYEPDYCRICVETLLTTGADNVGGPARTTAHGTVAQAIAAAYHSRLSTGGAHFHNENYEGWVDTVTYGCWKKETLERIGMFDEALVRNQDDELNLRLRKSGGKVWQNPKIVSIYSPRTTISGLFGQYFQYGFWKVAVARKHGWPGSWRHFVPVSFVATNLVLFAAILAFAIARMPSALLVTSTLWLVEIGLYLAVILTASLVTARNEGWAMLPLLPVVFAAYHLSYGFGFLMGMSPYRNQRPAASGAESVFARITR